MIGWALAAAGAVIATLLIVHPAPKKPAEPKALRKVVFHLFQLGAQQTAIVGTGLEKDAAAAVDMLYAGYAAQGLSQFAVYATENLGGILAGLDGPLVYLRRSPDLPEGSGPGGTDAGYVPTKVTLLPLLANEPFPPLGSTLTSADQSKYAALPPVLADNLALGLGQADVLYASSSDWQHGIVMVGPDGLVAALYRQPGTPPDVLPGFS